MSYFYDKFGVDLLNVFDYEEKYLNEDLPESEGGVKKGYYGNFMFISKKDTFKDLFKQHNEDTSELQYVNEYKDIGIKINNDFLTPDRELKGGAKLKDCFQGNGGASVLKKEDISEEDREKLDKLTENHTGDGYFVDYYKFKKILESNNIEFEEKK